MDTSYFFCVNSIKIDSHSGVEGLNAVAGKTLFLIHRVVVLHPLAQKTVFLVGLLQHSHMTFYPIILQPKITPTCKWPRANDLVCILFQPTAGVAQMKRGYRTQYLISGITHLYPACLSRSKPRRSLILYRKHNIGRNPVVSL